MSCPISASAAAGLLLLLFVGGAAAAGCPANCVTCTTSRSFWCTRCKDGYLPSKGTCVPVRQSCAVGKAGCQACNPRARTCTLCLISHWSFSLGKWTDVYALTKYGTCTMCATRGPNAYACAKCDASDPTKCTLCKDPKGSAMYIDEDGACQKCPLGCFKCKDYTGFCTQCDGEHHWKPYGGGCQKFA